jgi:hypothetical protein
MASRNVVAVAEHMATSSYPLPPTAISVAVIPPVTGDTTLAAASGGLSRADETDPDDEAGLLPETFSDLKEFGDAVDQLALDQGKQARVICLCMLTCRMCHTVIAARGCCTAALLPLLPLGVLPGMTQLRRKKERTKSCRAV